MERTCPFYATPKGTGSISSLVEFLRRRGENMYLRGRADSKGTCGPSIKSIGKDLHLSRSKVKRALNELGKAEL